MVHTPTLARYKATGGANARTFGKAKTMYATIALILAVICFGIGALSKVAPGDINWTNAGLCFVTLSLLL